MNSDLNFIFCVKGMNVQSHRISPFMSKVWWMEESGEDKNLFSAVKWCWVLTIIILLPLAGAKNWSPWVTTSHQTFSINILASGCRIFLFASCVRLVNALSRGIKF